MSGANQFFGVQLYLIQGRDDFSPASSDEGFLELRMQNFTIEAKPCGDACCFCLSATHINDRPKNGDTLSNDSL